MKDQISKFYPDLSPPDILYEALHGIFGMLLNYLMFLDVLFQVQIDQWIVIIEALIRMVSNLFVL